MNLNQGKRNKQAVQVLNKVEYDSEGNPIGMMEDPSNPASANFGTPRDPRRGGCYRGDGTSYVDLGNIPSYQVQNFRLTLTIANLNRINPTYNRRFFGIQVDHGGMSRGWYLSIYPGGTFYCVFRGTYTTDLYVNPQVADKYDVIIEKIGSTAKLTINEVTTSDSNVSLIYPSSGGRSTLFNLFGKSQNQYSNCDIFGVKYYELDDSGNVVSLLGKYNCSENSGDICYDSSGNGNHGTIINAITTTPEENPNSIHQYQDVYSFENEEGYSESGSVLIPKNSSITLPPFKDVLGNNLQYVGKVPGKAKFVGSSCFKGDSSAYLAITGLLTTDTIEVFGSSGTPTIPTNGELHVVEGDEVYGVKILRDGVLWSYLPLCEPIIDPSNHIYHDVSGNGNHATLINGTLANEGKQDEFHYLQRGFIKRSTGEIIPILEDESCFADGSLLADVDAIPQDSHSFLNTGTELEAYDYPALKQADKDGDFWYEDDGLGTITPKPVQFDSLITQKGLSDKLFLDSSVSETIKNVRMYGNDLKGRQLNTENKLTNN